MITIRAAAKRLDAKSDTLCKDVRGNPTWFHAKQQPDHVWLIDDQSEGYRAWETRTTGPGRKQWGGHNRKEGSL